MADEAAEALAHYAATTSYASLPPEVVTALKRILLDTLGTTLAATTLGVGRRELVQVVRDAGGTPEATLLGLGDRVPALAAALANGGLSHALNFDDVSAGGAGHMGVTSIPAALAVAEKHGGIPGRDFLAAMASGCEVMARIGVAIKRSEEGYTESKPQPTQMPGYFSCAAAAGRALGLTPPQMHSAFGLALMQCGGGRQPVLEGRPAKAIYAAFCNQGGALSALLAAQGLEADCDLLLGEAGFFKTFYGGRYDRAVLVEGLGKEFYLLNVGFKPWPTTGVAHPFILAALELRGRLDPSSIEKVHLIGGEHAQTFCEPLATRTQPKSPVEAEDSVPFSVAKALANGRLGLADLQPGRVGLDQPEAVRIAGRISYSIEASLGSAGIVEVTAGGQEYRARVDKAPPMGYEALVEKFMDCAGLAAAPLPEGTLRRVVEMVERLEEVEDVAAIPALLGGR